MNEKITIDMLTDKSVSIKRQNYTIIDGIEYPIGNVWRKAYANNETGREELKSELDEKYVKSIFGVWEYTEETI